MRSINEYESLLFTKTQNKYLISSARHLPHRIERQWAADERELLLSFYLISFCWLDAGVLLNRIASSKEIVN